MNATKLLRIISIALAALVLMGIVGCMLLEYGHSFKGFLFAGFVSMTLCGFPAGVSGVLSFFTKSWISLVILTVASLLYGIFFAGVAHGINNSLDNQAGMVFLIVGFVSLPVMVPLWIAALVIEWWHHRRMRMEGARQTPPPLQGDEK